VSSRPTDNHPPERLRRPGCACQWRGHVLIVEPEPLTQWALRMYLQRWFSVESTDSLAIAQRVFSNRAIDGLVISDELAPTATAALEQTARFLNPDVHIIRTVSDTTRPFEGDPQTDCLEKPFELARVARLLGIAAHELPNGDVSG
jgi:DNA-binding NtrC family response regulator